MATILSEKTVVHVEVEFTYRSKYPLDQRRRADIANCLQEYADGELAKRMSATRYVDEAE